MIQKINQETGVPVARIQATVELLERGASVPFIARYRKDATGNLDETRVRAIADRRIAYRQLEERRGSILSAVAKEGPVDEEIRNRILNCEDRQELEDLYLPYRSRRLTRGAIARKRGLEGLAAYIRQGGFKPVRDHAFRFIDVQHGVPSTGAAIEGALHILAEQMAEDCESRKWLRNKMLSEGVVRTSVTRAKADEKTKYSMYYDFSEPASRIPSHRMLAVRRAARQNILTFSVQIDHGRALADFKTRFSIRPDSESGELLERAADDAYRQLEPSIQKEVRSLLRSRAEDEAIAVFQENLRALLLAPPAGEIPLIGVDPGVEKGVHVAAVGPQGGLLEHATLRLAGADQDLDTAERVLVAMINGHAIRGIVVGSGRGLRETERFVRSCIAKFGLEAFVVVATESAASVSAGKHARQEFPDLEAGMRRAISTARRLQDPLSELVNVDPRTIGVGQYQHDVDQRKLKARLTATIESAVNRVGADVNTASVDLLRYIAGLSEGLARSIVAHRTEHGSFSERRQLRQVEGFDDAAFEQAAGFLRIGGGPNPLDRTSIHPESYGLVDQMAESLDVTVADLVENPSRVQALDLERFERDAGRFTLADIRAELLEPARDPRKKFVPPRQREAVLDAGDLKEGMELEGVVTNVTNFGAFVDLGVHQDGLIHISELSHRYVADARRAVQVGSVVKVKVIGVDPDTKRISLSRKALVPKPAPRRPKPKVRTDDAAPQPERGKPRIRRPRTKEAAVSLKRDAAPPPKPVSMEEKIRRLQEKFKAPDR